MTIALNKSQLRDLLLKNWMTHDALWYAEVALKLGMKEASPMNLRVCRRLGQIEYKRLLNVANISPPANMEQFQTVFDIGRQVFVPDFMSLEIAYPVKNLLQIHVLECFAHRGMEKAGQLAEYECGIFERIFGWFDAMNLNYTVEPDLTRCLKFKGRDCIVTFRFQF